MQQTVTCDIILQGGRIYKDLLSLLFFFLVPVRQHLHDRIWHKKLASHNIASGIPKSGAENSGKHLNGLKLLKIIFFKLTMSLESRRLNFYWLLG